MKSNRTLPILVLSLALLTACGDNSGVVAYAGDNKTVDDIDLSGDLDPNLEWLDPSVPANTIELEKGVYIEPGLHLRPGIKVFSVDPSHNADALVDDVLNQATVQGAALADINGIKTGDIFLTQDYIARVSSVDASDTQTVLGLTTFEMMDVVHGSWKMNIPLDKSGDARYPIDPTTLETRRQMLGLSFALDYSGSGSGIGYEAGVDLTFGASPHLSFEGEIPFYESSSGYECSDPQFKADIACAFGRCAKRYRYCVDYLMVRVDLSASLSGEAGLTARLEGELTTPKDKRADEQSLGQIPVFGPFFLRPSAYIDRQAYVKASLEAKLQMTFDASVVIPLGFEYRNGQGMSVIPNGNYGIEAGGGLGAEAMIEGALEAGIWAETGLELSLCTPDLPVDACFKGMQMGERVTVKAEYTHNFGGASDEPCLTAEATISTKVTGKVEFEADLSVVSFSKTVLEATWTPLSQTLASWDGGGKFCFDRQEQLAEMNAIYDRDIDCGSSENPYLGTCVDDFAKHCFDPTGTCSGTVYEDNSFDMEWTTGEHYFSTLTQRPIPGTPVTAETKGEWFSKEDELCATSKTSVSYMSGGAAGCLYTSIITLEIADEEMLAGGYEKGDVIEICGYANGSQDVTCPDASQFTVGADDTENAICLTGGRCKFEIGFLDDLEANRKDVRESSVPGNAM